MPVTLRLGLFYAAIFVGTGASLPYIPVWFRSHGLSGAQIGLILSAPMLVRVLVSPVLAIWADTFRLRRTPLMLMGLAAGLAYGAIGLLHDFTGWLIAWLIGSCLLAALAPLGDVLTMRLARREGFSYGWPRGIGSVAFVCANLGVGALLTVTTPDLILVWTAGAAGLAGLLALQLPAEPVDEDGVRSRKRDRFRGLEDLVRNRIFMLAVVSSALIQATHAFYYGFSALLWRREAIPEAAVGALWATGVAAEVAFMWFAEPWRRRWGPERMVVLGGLAAIVRWVAYAFSPPLWLLFPLQALHALSFTATFMGSLQLIERHAPARAASAAQTFSSALAGGLFIGLATLMSGRLFDAFGAHGYLAMAAVTVLGVGGALVLARGAAGRDT